MSSYKNHVDNSILTYGNFSITHSNNQDDVWVSVIVPMYNVENLIAETIQSLKNNFSSIEFLLIDDGSKDNTVLKAKEAIGDDKRFCIIEKENSGVSDTRNLGIKLAKGTYLLFCDSDDLMTDNAIDKLLLSAISEKADLVLGGIKRFNSKKIWTIPAHDKHNLFSRGRKSIGKNPELFLSMAPYAKLIHKNIIKENFFPSNIHCSEDQVVTFNIFIRAKNIYCIGDYIYLYRERDLVDNEQSITQQRDLKAYDFLQDIFSVMRINYDNIMDDSGYTLIQKNKIIVGYYERALTFDVYPLFIRVLKHQPYNSGKAFLLIQEFFQSFDDEFFNQVAGFRYFFLRNLIDKLYLVKTRYFLNYYSLVKTTFSKLSDKTKLACEKHWGKKWFENLAFVQKNTVSAFFYFLYLRNKKQIFQYLNVNGENIIKKYIFPIYRLLPIDDKKIVFATSTKGKMSTNFTFLLNEIKKSGSSYEIKKFLGYSNSFLRNMSRYYHLATAKNIILESYYRPLYGLTLKNNTNCIQIWHACGAFKKFGFSAIGAGDSNSEEFERLAHNFYTHVVVSSELTGQIYHEAFNVSKDKIYPLGVPRTDVFFNQSKITKIKKKILADYPDLTSTINVLYAPTFRGSPSERKNFRLPFSFEIFDDMPENYRFIIKLHPVVDITNIKIPTKYQKKVFILPSSQDVNEWMIFCDILITDYSSLIFEYALLNKPIIFYPYDMDQYFDERGFYFDYYTYVYGQVIKNQNEIISSILNAKLIMGDFQELKKLFIDRFMANCYGKSSEKIIENIINHR
ncbi:bifunctional glycosyltransferase/CDP-glycerol:glycerophosphate glycerophosphotransferase [Moraxella oblonga]|uniref:bifunctional glycosyltransferase/CDP-glycerol:glycerophosphate glycerophosphotransferase n=1 Tax=Moraxella oblonga TaxID=200413 RepID=UPI00082D6D0E|nr:CDP-glycerol glycerophosphotransferase family protein [Moraxella oblonga]